MIDGEGHIVHIGKIRLSMSISCIELGLRLRISIRYR
jgi:hypothetical protein